MLLLLQAVEFCSGLLCSNTKPEQWRKLAERPWTGGYSDFGKSLRYKAEGGGKRLLSHRTWTEMRTLAGCKQGCTAMKTKCAVATPAHLECGVAHATQSMKKTFFDHTSSVVTNKMY